jgi:hypothetical protein
MLYQEKSDNPGPRCLLLQSKRTRFSWQAIFPSRKSIRVGRYAKTFFLIKNPTCRDHEGP